MIKKGHLQRTSMGKDCIANKIVEKGNNQTHFCTLQISTFHNDYNTTKSLSRLRLGFDGLAYNTAKFR